MFQTLTQAQRPKHHVLPAEAKPHDADSKMIGISFSSGLDALRQTDLFARPLRLSWRSNALCDEGLPAAHTKVRGQNALCDERSVRDFALTRFAVNLVLGM